MPHFIRLRGPWNWQPVSRWTQNPSGEWQLTANDLPQGGAIVLPGDWNAILGENHLGSVLFTRTFRCPQAIAAAAHVSLEIEDANRQAKVELNDQLLGEIISSQLPAAYTVQRCPARFDITRLLRPSNLLSVTVTSSPPDEGKERCGHLGLVRLAIH
jgi:beta-galactosidase/beta-glucuronidase